MPPVKKSFEDYRAYRISPGDTNRLAIIVDPIGEQTSFIACVEVFDVGGRTPPNVHIRAHEMFFVLAGEGLAHADGATFAIKAGAPAPASRRAPRDPEHGSDASLQAHLDGVEEVRRAIRSGTPVELDDEDRAVLGR